jgi:hypothetical protein
MIKLIVIPLLLIATVVFSQQPPDTEIYLFDLVIKKRKVSLANPVNVTNRKGYDNQPLFHPDDARLFYASADADGRTNILVYNYESGTTTTVTNTPEREYSPTVTPDKQYVSSIIQRDDGSQDLGKYPIGGGEAEIIIDNLIVGYHAWLDENHVLVFVLGSPNSLRLYAVREKKDLLISENIGRSLHRIPGTNDISFVSKQEKEWSIKKYIWKDGSIEIIAPTLPGREDLAWTPDQKIIMSDGEQLFFWNTKGPGKWTAIPLPPEKLFSGITRIAVNSKGNKIALVVNE